MKAKKVFLDTSILLYAAQGRRSEPAKHDIARSIIVDQDYHTSAQVLAEFFANVVQKGATPLKADVARRWVTSLAKKPCLPMDAALVQQGIETSARFGLSFWDGAIIAAAERLKLDTVLSEDMTHRQTYGSVTVINPFKDTDTDTDTDTTTNSAI